MRLRIVSDRESVSGPEVSVGSLFHAFLTIYQMNGLLSEEQVEKCREGAITEVEEQLGYAVQNFYGF